MAKKFRGFKIINEFKEFALKGNVVDLAVGIIIGSAFQSIVNSLVSDIIMPFISFIGGNMDYSNWFIILGNLPDDYDAGRIGSLTYVKNTLGIPVFAYGSFITAVLNFLIMAFIIFLLVKFINRLRLIGEKLEVVGEKEEDKKECLYCKSKIPIKAVRCPHCTSELEEGSAEDVKNEREEK